LRSIAAIHAPHFLARVRAQVNAWIRYQFGGRFLSRFRLSFSHRRLERRTSAQVARRWLALAENSTTERPPVRAKMDARYDVQRQAH
jgi:hypothetical protein